MRRSTARTIWFLLSFAAGAVLPWLLSGRLVETSGAGRGSIGLDLADAVSAFRSGLLREPPASRVAFIGDSMLWQPTAAPPLAVRVARMVNESPPPDPPLVLRTLETGGLTVIPEYCLVDEIADARPALVVLELNLRGLAPGPLGAYGFAELAGRIRGARLAEAAFAPLSDAGLTLDRLLFYRLLTKAGLETPWGRLVDRQARLVTAKDAFEEGLDRLAGTDTAIRRRFAGMKVILERAWVEGRPRATRENIVAQLGAVLGGLERDSRLRVLELLLRDLRRAGIPVLVWVSPINVQYIRSLGLPVDGLPRAMARIRAAVRDAGAELADLHALLPEVAFRDPGDHYTLEGEPDGTEIVAREIALAIRRVHRERVARPGGGDAVQ